MEEDLLGLLGDDKRTAQAPEILLHVERERERETERERERETKIERTAALPTHYVSIWAGRATKPRSYSSQALMSLLLLTPSRRTL